MQLDYTIFRDMVRACRDVDRNWMRFSDVRAQVPRRSLEQIDECIRRLETEGEWELHPLGTASRRYDCKFRVHLDRLPPAKIQTVQ